MRDKPMDTTEALLVRVQGGDAAARGQLMDRFLPSLQRWARGKIPRRARSVIDTDDLVQDTLLRSLRNVQGFEYRRDGAFLASLRTIFMNRLRDVISGVERRPRQQPLEHDPAQDDDPSPLDELMGRELHAAYERGLERLPVRQREAVIMRVEHGFTFPEIAESLGFTNANSARMSVVRGLDRLAEFLDV